MKRIAALSLVAAMAATGASAQNATTKPEPTVSSQFGAFGGAGIGIQMGIISAITIGAVVIAANDNSGT